MERKYEGRPGLVKPLVISLLLPVFGGVYEFFRHRESDPDFAEVMLFGGFSLPAWFLAGQALSMVSFSNFWSLTTAIILFVVLTKKLFVEDNKYADVLWIHYLFLFGAVYSYQLKYKGNHELKYLVYHGTAQAFAYALIIGLLLGTLSTILLIMSPTVLPILPV